jgi:hypothetical protein
LLRMKFHTQKVSFWKGGRNLVQHELRPNSKFEHSLTYISCNIF